MSDITSLEAKYKELGAEIRALKNRKRVKTWPQIGDLYFVILGNGEIEGYSWDNDNQDRSYKASFNIYSTVAKATKELETRKTIAELRAQPGRVKFIQSKRNWCIRVSHEISSKVYADWFYNEECGFATVYFESKEAATKALYAVGMARIIAAYKWLSMVE